MSWVIGPVRCRRRPRGETIEVVDAAPLVEVATVPD
jgi:hypothetical protein